MGFISLIAKAGAAVSSSASTTANNAPALGDTFSWVLALGDAQGWSVISPLSICVAFFSIIGTLTIGGSVLPQTIDTIKNRQTQSFAMLMYIFLVVGCFFLAIYGIGLVCAGGAIENNYYGASNIAQYKILFNHWYSKLDKDQISAFSNAVATYGPTEAVAAIISNHLTVGSGVDVTSVKLFGSVAMPAFNDDVASLLGDKIGLVNQLVVTPGAYRNYQVNYTTPGGLLIIGEGFASLTSLVVLWIKVQNIVKAKAAHMTEAEFCAKLLEEIKAKKAMKGAH